jgi:hypothetical protein
MVTVERTRSTVDVHSRVRVIVEDESETQPNVDNNPTGWKTAHELIGRIKEELVADRHRGNS